MKVLPIIFTIVIATALGFGIYYRGTIAGVRKMQILYYGDKTPVNYGEETLKDSELKPNQFKIGQRVVVTIVNGWYRDGVIEQFSTDHALAKVNQGIGSDWVKVSALRAIEETSIPR